MTPDQRKEMLCVLAEKVLGYELVYDLGGTVWFRDPSEETREIWIDVGGGQIHPKPWSPLESIADAWMIVEALMKRGLCLSVECDPSTLDHFIVNIWQLDGGRLGKHLSDYESRTAPEAICHAGASLYTLIGEPEA
jgi:hypothetical protein